jgi:hypothetical protein
MGEIKHIIDNKLRKFLYLIKHQYGEGLNCKKISQGWSISYAGFHVEFLRVGAYVIRVNINECPLDDFIIEDDLEFDGFSEAIERVFDAIHNGKYMILNNECDGRFGIAFEINLFDPSCKKNSVLYSRNKK